MCYQSFLLSREKLCRRSSRSSELTYSVANLTGLPPFHSKALSKKLAKFSDLAKDFVLQCSDQLTVTGIIYVVILRTRQACELSAYHYDVVVDLLHVTCITVMLAVVSTTEFWEKNWLGILRVAGGAVLFVLTSFVLILRKVSGMDISPAGTNAELLVLPAVCFADAAERNPLSSNLGADDVLFGIVVVLWAYWLLMDAVASAIGRFGLSNTKPRPRAVTTTFRGGGSEAALLVASCFVVPFGFGVAALIFHAVHVVRLRRWVERSGWLSREDGINPEADLFAIGQALPAALFILVLIPGLSFIFRFFDLIWTFYRTPPESSLALSDGGRSRPGSDISLAPLTRCHGREP